MTRWAAGLGLLAAMACTPTPARPAAEAPRRRPPAPVEVVAVERFAARIATELVAAPVGGTETVEAFYRAFADPASTAMVTLRTRLRGHAAALAGRVQRVWVSPLTVHVAGVGTSRTASVWTCTVVAVAGAADLAARFSTERLTLREVDGTWRLVDYSSTRGPTPALFEPATPTSVAVAALAGAAAPR